MRFSQLAVFFHTNWVIKPPQARIGLTGPGLKAAETQAVSKPGIGNTPHLDRRPGRSCAVSQPARRGVGAASPSARQSPGPSAGRVAVRSFCFFTSAPETLEDASESAL